MRRAEQLCPQGREVLPRRIGRTRLGGRILSKEPEPLPQSTSSKTLEPSQLPLISAISTLRDSAKVEASVLPAVFVDARPHRSQVGILLVEQTLAPTLGLFSYADEPPDFRPGSNVPIRHARSSVLFALLRQVTLLHLSIVFSACVEFPSIALTIAGTNSRESETHDPLKSFPEPALAPALANVWRSAQQHA